MYNELNKHYSVFTALAYVSRNTAPRYPYAVAYNFSQLYLLEWFSQNFLESLLCDSFVSYINWPTDNIIGGTSNKVPYLYNVGGNIVPRVLCNKIFCNTVTLLTEIIDAASIIIHIFLISSTSNLLISADNWYQSIQLLNPGLDLSEGKRLMLGSCTWAINPHRFLNSLSIGVLFCATHFLLSLRIGFQFHCLQNGLKYMLTTEYYIFENIIVNIFNEMYFRYILCISDVIQWITDTFSFPPQKNN